jgi:hypothetical protein
MQVDDLGSIVRSRTTDATPISARELAVAVPVAQRRSFDGNGAVP